MAMTPINKGEYDTLIVPHLEAMQKLLKNSDLEYLITVVSPPAEDGTQDQQIYANISQNPLRGASVALRVASGIIKDGLPAFFKKLSDCPPPGLIKDPDAETKLAMVEVMLGEVPKDEPPSFNGQS